MFTIIITELIVIFIYMTSWFCIAMRQQRNDVADVAWGPGFIVCALTALLLAESISWRAIFVFLLVVIWGLRLAVRIYARNSGKQEDPRYVKWRQEWAEHLIMRTFLQIFLLQGVLILIISAPVLSGIMAESSSPGLWDLMGLLVWLAGFFFEAVGDRQLDEFKAAKAAGLARGKILQSGLWRYSRHPNYFGEVIMWWGIYLIALTGEHGWATFVGPLVITFLILQVSGIPLAEAHYADNREFRVYKEKTSAFFPLPPKQTGDHL